MTAYEYDEFGEPAEQQPFEAEYHTTTDCDHCGRTARCAVYGPYGGVLAICDPCLTGRVDAADKAAADTL